jgi:hypothetical protein
MSQENVGLAHNVELARALFQALNGDVEAFIVLCDPSIELHSRWVAVGGVTAYHGHEGVRRWAREVEEAWEDIHLAVEAYFDLGERTLAFYTGLAGLWEAWRGILSAWEDFRIEAEYRELDPERVLVLHRFSGRGKTSGLEIGQTSAKGASLFHICRSKVPKAVTYLDRERALTDLGLKE